jgi:twitching motility protein PilT
MMNDQQRARFEQNWTLDFSIQVDEIRYRANVFYQRHGMEAVLRLIPSRIPTVEELFLPPSIVQLAELTRGLVLTTGPTGSGKTTTQAALINIINQTRRANIITIEDPIEFLYTSKNSLISQREIGVHAPDFSSALKYILRQDPDVVLLGEMRDFETISAALTVAETGHLVFGTLHTMDAAQAVDRIIDVFPYSQQPQVRTQLASVLQAVISQTLIPRAHGRGRVPACEMVMVTPAVANLIRQGKTHEIYSAIDMGAQNGMLSLERSISDLVRRGLVDPSELTSRQIHQKVI